MKVNSKLIIFTFFACILGCSNIFAEGSEDQNAFLPTNVYAVKWDSNYTGHCKHGHYIDANNNNVLALHSCENTEISLAFFKNKLYELFGFPIAPQYLVKDSKVYAYGDDNKHAIVMKDTPLGRPLSGSLEEAQEKMPEQLAKLHLIAVLIGDLAILKENDGGYGAFIDGDHILIGHNCVYSDKYLYSNALDLATVSDNLLYKIRSAWNYDPELKKISHKIFHTCTTKHLDEIIAWFDNSWDEQKVTTLFQESGLKDEKILTNLKSRFQDLKKTLEEAKAINWSYLPSSTDTNMIQWDIDRTGYSYGYEYGHYVDDNNKFLAISDFWRDDINLAFFKNKLYGLFGFATVAQYLVARSAVRDSGGWDSYYADRKAIVMKGDTPGKPLSNSLEEVQEKMPEQLAQLFLTAVLVDDLTILNENNENYGAFIDNDHLLISHNCSPRNDNSPIRFSSQVSSIVTDNLLERIRSADSSNKTNKIAQKMLKNCTSKHLEAAIAWLDHSWDEQKVTTLFQESGLKDEKILANLKLRFQDLRKTLEEAKANYWSYLPTSTDTVQWNRDSNAYDYEYGHYVDDNDNKFLAISNYSTNAINTTNLAFFKNKLYGLFGFATAPQYLVARSAVSDSNYTDKKAIVVKGDAPGKPLSSSLEEAQEKMPEQLARLFIMTVLVDDIAILSKNNENYGAFIDNDHLLISHNCNPNNGYDYSRVSLDLSSIVTDSLLERIRLADSSNKTNKIAQNIFKNCTSKHLDAVIAWFDRSWDDQKITALFKDSGLKDEQILTNLKSRFENLKKGLQAALEKEKTKQTYADYLPIDSSKIIWNSTGHYSYATYTAVNQDKIFAVRSCGLSEAIFKNKLYEILGFSMMPQYLADIDDFNLDVQQNSSSCTNSSRDIFIVKANPTSKPLSKCSDEEIKGKLDEIAKLHIIATITGDLDIFAKSDIENYGYGAFIDNNRLLIGHFHQPDKMHRQSPMADKDLFKKSLAPQYNWEASKVTQKIFQDYTLNHIQEIIAWLDSHWDEAKIEALFTHSNPTDQQSLTGLKQRFHDVRNGLAQIEKEGYKPYSYEKISSLINNKKTKVQDNFSVKNVYYKYQESIPPKTTEQLMLCSNGNKVWLEITNFEFLVNGKESNKIVKIYIGDVTKKDSLVATEKQIIEIFDPETAFIFSDAVIRYWDTLSPSGTTEDSYQKLSKAITQGYFAIGNHFGISYQLESMSPANSIHSFKDLDDFCNILQEEYHTAANNIGRYVTHERINQLRELGFEAYYPNPAYLGDIAHYARTSEISYNDYINREQRSSFNVCNKDYLSKSADINYNFCDDYTRPIEKLYPRDICFENVTATYSANDFKRVSAYTFRGDSRDISDIYKDAGFWTYRCNTLNHGIFDSKKCKEQILNDADSWRIPLCGKRPCPAGQAYVSTSKIIDVTKGYGANVYAVFAEGGIHLPSDFGGTKVYDSVSDLKEIAVPGMIPWENIVGTRTRSRNYTNHHVHSEGPIFLKSGLAENDRANFWGILQIMGDKPQCSGLNSDNITQLCLSALAKPDDSDLIKQSIKKEFVSRITQEDGIAVVPYWEKYSEDFELGEICELVLQNAIGLEHRISRKSYQISPSIVETKPVNTEKFWNILSTQEVNGKEIIEQLSQDKAIKNLFEKSAGLFEGYTVQEHTLMVFAVFKEQFNNYNKHFKFNVPSDIRLFETLKMAIALHDIGKSLADERGDKERQHEYTIPILKFQLKKFNFSTNEINFVQSLVGHDIIGGLMQQKISLEEAKSRLQTAANNAKMSLHDFLPLQLLFYTIDAASYPAVRQSYFTQNNGLLVSNNPQWEKLINDLI